MANMILFAAVTDKMAENAIALIKSLGLSIPVISTTRENVLEQIKKYPECEIYISRGGVGQAIENSLNNKTLISLNIGVEEVFEYIHSLAKKGCKRILVAAVHGMVTDTDYDFDLGEITLFFRQNQNRADGRGTSIIIEDSINQNKIDGVITDASGCKFASQKGLPSILLDCNNASLERAINQALTIAANIEKQKEKDEVRMEKIHEYAGHLFTVIDQAIAEIKTLESSTNRLNEISLEAAGNAKQSHDQVNNTYEAVSIIKKIASQSQLLGLNGAIESARAGVAGRSFAIITKEIQQMAANSAESAEWINENMETLMNNVQIVLKSVENINEIANEQKNKSDLIAEMLKDLTNVEKKLVDAINER